MLKQSTSPAPGKSRILWALVPLLAFSALGIMFAIAIFSGDPSKLPSALVGKPAPQASFGPLNGVSRDGQQVPGFGPAKLKSGKITVVNFWASWCGPCIAEHPQIVALSQHADVAVFGVNYKDEARDAKRFLGRHGNPFTALGIDPLGRGAIEWGVAKLPETFIVNAEGAVIYKHTGPISRDDLSSKIVPLLESTER